MNRQEMIIRAKELEHEYDTKQNYSYWLNKLNTEYMELAKALGVPNADIRTITNRITTPKKPIEVDFQVTGKTPLHNLTSTNGSTLVDVELLHPKLQTIIRKYHNNRYILCIFDRRFITILCNNRKPFLEIVIEKITY